MENPLERRGCIELSFPDVYIESDLYQVTSVAEGLGMLACVTLHSYMTAKSIELLLLSSYLYH